MPAASILAACAGALLVAKWGMELWLGWLNRRHVLAHAEAVPPAFKDSIDPATYAKSVQYTLAKHKLSSVEDTVNLGVVGLLLFSGVLPWAFRQFLIWQGDSAWAMAAFLFGVGLVLSLAGLPLDWYAQFRLEERFGFNTTTLRTWCLDRVKGLLLALLLGYPLLALILQLASWSDQWWLWAWGCVLGFQCLMMVLAPVLILPLFNKFTPLPEGSLRNRLMALAERAQFRARSIQVMDGSKRSRHSNAFFTGFGGFRKIVLFDTLMQQLNEPELEAVLAHEIGHYRLKHIPKMLAWSAASLFGAFYVLGWLANQPTFYQAFGFEGKSYLAPALLLFSLLSGAVTFWFSPLFHWWSRSFEYQADAFAAEAMKEPQPLVSALRKLNEKNLGNLTPHPLYSGFYYSHPTLLEREQALLKS